MARERSEHEGEYLLEDGAYVPRVTKILSCIAKPALLNWGRATARDNVIREAAAFYGTLSQPITPSAFAAALKKRATWSVVTAGVEDAADFGTILHQRVEAEMRTELGERVKIPVLPKTWVDRDGKETPHPVGYSYESYLAWRQAHRVRPIKAEVRVISRALGYGGTIDLFAAIDDEETLIDYKTSKAVYPEYRIQVAAYRQAALESRQASKILPALIVRFPKTEDDNFEPVTVGLDEQGALMDAFLAALTLYEGGYGR